MLRINLKNNVQISQTDISDGINSMSYAFNDSELIVNYNSHKLKGNDTLLLERIDGKDIVFRYPFSPQIINDNTFIINLPKYTYFNVNEISKVTIRRNPKGEAEEALIFFLDNGYNHYNVKNRDDVVIKEYITDGTEVTSNRIKRRCAGDYILYNSYFRFIADGAIDNRYIFGDNFDNIENVSLNFYSENSIITLSNVIVPSDSVGKDRTDMLIWFYPHSQSNIANMLSENNPYLFFCYDSRFFNFEGGYVSLKSDENSKLYKEQNNISVNIPFGEILSTDMDNEMNYGSYHISQIKENSIPQAVDYEKRQFSPVYMSSDGISNDGESIFVDDDVLKEVKEIDFNLHFRSRSNLEDWESEDGDLWNNYPEIDAKTNTLRPLNNSLSVENADLIGKIGFTDEDVYYSKEALKKSFLRLSFYDSPDRRVQSLLFYSTIFVDGNKLLSKFYKNINNGIKDNVVHQEHITSIYSVDDNLRLGMNFQCTDKYTMGSSSEGFYLYLFPGISKGASCMPIYMKVEFNHAKFGKKIPFVLPIDENGAIIEPTNSKFPTSYTLVDKYNQVSTDMSRLFTDMYIKLLVKYDYNSNKYVWMLPRTMANCDGKIVFNLFEPRINGFITNDSVVVDRDLYQFRGRIIDQETGAYIMGMKTAQVYMMPSYVTTIQSSLAIKYNTDTNGYTGVHKTKENTIKWIVPESTYYYKAEGTAVSKGVDDIYDFNIPLKRKEVSDIKVTIKYKISEALFAEMEDSVYATTLCALLNGNRQSNAYVKDKEGKKDFVFTAKIPGEYTLGYQLSMLNEYANKYVKSVKIVDLTGVGINEDNTFTLKAFEDRHFQISIECYKESIDEKIKTKLDYYIVDLDWGKAFKTPNARVGIFVNGSNTPSQVYAMPLVAKTLIYPKVDRYFISGTTNIDRYSDFNLRIGYVSEVTDNSSIKLLDKKISAENLANWFGVSTNVLNEFRTETSHDAIGIFAEERYITNAGSSDDDVYWFRFQLWDGDTLVSKRLNILIKESAEATQQNIIEWPNEYIYTAHTSECQYRILEDVDGVYMAKNENIGVTNEKKGRANMITIDVYMERITNDSIDINSNVASILLYYLVSKPSGQLDGNYYLKFIYNNNGVDCTYTFNNPIVLTSSGELSSLPPKDDNISGVSAREIIIVPKAISNISFSKANWSVVDEDGTEVTGVQIDATKLGTIEIEGSDNSSAVTEIDGYIDLKFV